MKKKFISIVSPAYNEAKNLPILAGEVTAVMEELKNKYTYELIFVNDGSTDKTWEVIKAISKENKNIKGINLSRNFGHQLALTAGLGHATGDATIYLDSDLQHPPKLIPKMLDLWEKGYKIVHTKRIDTNDVGYQKKLLSRIFYKVLRYMTNINIEDGMADFKLLDAVALKSLNSMPEHGRFLRAMVIWLGFKSTIIEYKARKRKHGVPWYNFGRNLTFAQTGILAFSVKPLKFISVAGLFFAILSGIFMVVALIISLSEGTFFLSPNFAIELLNIFFTSILWVGIGILGQYLTVIYKEVLNRPKYIVEEYHNWKKL